MQENNNEKTSNIIYNSTSKHRRVRPLLNYSIWKISFEEEKHLFRDCLIKQYIEKDSSGYNLFLKNEKYVIIGENRISRNLKLSKFIIDLKSKNAHGYPADYVNKNQDKPNEEVLEKMLENKLITTSVYKKIRKGKEI